jgi:hypothetical protein
MPGRNPSSPADRRKNPARNQDRRASDSRTREYRVVPHGERWNVQCDGKATDSFADNVDSAIGLATAKAERDIRSGMSASVSIAEEKGTSRHVWP